MSSLSVLWRRSRCKLTSSSVFAIMDAHRLKRYRCSLLRVQGSLAFVFQAEFPVYSSTNVIVWQISAVFSEVVDIILVYLFFSEKNGFWLKYLLFSQLLLSSVHFFFVCSN